MWLDPFAELSHSKLSVLADALNHRGVKQSGIGSELGEYALTAYTIAKAVHGELSPPIGVNLPRKLISWLCYSKSRYPLVERKWRLNAPSDRMSARRAGGPFSLRMIGYENFYPSTSST